MKNISNRRKIKHLIKSIQRDYTAGHKELKLFFAEMGVYMNNSYSLYQIIKLFDMKKTQRLMKLCRRLGNAAKKRNCFVMFTEIFYYVRFHPETDFRTIKFHKVQTRHQKMFQTDVYFYVEKYDNVFNPINLSVSRKTETVCDSSTFEKTIEDLIKEDLL